VRAPSWMRVQTVELWADETLRFRASVAPAPRGRPLAWTVRTRLALAHASVLQAVAHGGSGLERLLGRSAVPPLAFTNPVRLSRSAELLRDAAAVGGKPTLDLRFGRESSRCHVVIKGHSACVRKSQ
jgi:hypothetical protein